MKIEIEMPVAELKAALPGFSKIISRKASLPVLGCLKIALDEDEEFIRIGASNLSEFVEFRMQNVADGFSGELLVPFEELAKVVKACPVKSAIRVLADEERTIIRYPLAGNFVDQPVDRIDPKEWPVCPKFDGEAIPLAAEFKETLKQALECASADSTRYVLNGACLDVTGEKGHYVVGTNGSHLFAANSFRFDLDASVLVPAKRFVCWDSFVEDGSWYLRTLPKTKDRSPYLRIDSERWSYIVAQIEGQYPNWKQVMPIPNENWTHLVFEEPAVELLLGIMPMMPGRDVTSQPVELQVRDNQLFVKGKSKSGATSESRVDGATITGEPVEISLDRNYLLKALRFGFRQVHIENPVSALLFTKAGKSMVVMPVRGEAAEKYYQSVSPKNSPSETAAAAEAPSTAEQKPTTEPERTEMPEPTFKAPQRANLKSHETESSETSAMDELLEQVENTRTHLREVFNGLNEMTTTLKKVAKEKKNTEKEINKFRASLRSLQQVEI